MCIFICDIFLGFVCFIAARVSQSWCWHRYCCFWYCSKIFRKKKKPQKTKKTKYFFNEYFFNVENLQPFQLESHYFTSRPAMSAQTRPWVQKIMHPINSEFKKVVISGITCFTLYYFNITSISLLHLQEITFLDRENLTVKMPKLKHASRYHLAAMWISFFPTCWSTLSSS